MARTAADALPGTRAGDGALAAVVLLLGLIDVAASVDPSLPGLPGLFDGTAAIAAGVVTTSAQAGTVLFRRRWPRRAYALLALVAAVQFVAIGAYPTYAWAVLAFAVARAPGRALGWLAGPLLAAVVAGAALVPIAPGDLLTRAATAVALALTLAVFVLVGALAGRFARAAAGRADWERAAPRPGSANRGADGRTGPDRRGNRQRCAHWPSPAGRAVRAARGCRGRRLAPAERAGSGRAGRHASRLRHSAC
ncbi:hypothetical protein [Fodinicola feengrottensis]|uniref:hypothetical protein n=1 Tax=Fodinicola feengrottensis TaxID=435914 RepID=UPI0013CFF132|nr:hypothetical protein [Fodinicola feengrottensis]